MLPEYLQGLPAAIHRDSPALLFTPGMPAVNYFPFHLASAARSGTARRGSTLLGYGDAQGELVLRKPLLATSRSPGDPLRSQPDSDYRRGAGRRRLCTHLLSVAGDMAWVEEPGYPGSKSIFLKSGLHIKGVPVDREGMRLDTSADSKAPRLIFTSPSHQYPAEP